MPENTKYFKISSLLNTLNLSFQDKKVEEKYRQHLLDSDSKQNRAAILLFAIPLLYFIRVDYSFWGLANEFWMLLSIRLILVFVSAMMYLFLLSSKKVDKHDKVMFIWVLCVGLGISLINFSRPQEYFYHLLFDILLILASYVFILNKPVFQVIPAWIYSFGVIIQFSFFEDHDISKIIIIFIALILTNICGLFVSYNFHNYRRSRYLIQNELTSLLNTDPLTQIANRRCFYKQAEKVNFGRKSSTSACSLMLIDIDFFKKVNDTYGHQIGDEYLKAFSNLLKSVCEQNHLVSRYGGEEFIYFLPNTSIQTTEKIAEKIRIKAHDIKINKNNHFVFSVSIGICVSTTTDKNIDHLISRADKALYKAKASGRDCVVKA